MYADTQASAKCEDGYTLNESLCQKVMTTTPCENGYTLNADRSLCQKVMTTKPCENGYTLNDSLLCEKTVTTSPTYCTKASTVDELLKKLYPGETTLYKGVCTVNPNRGTGAAMSWGYGDKDKEEFAFVFGTEAKVKEWEQNHRIPCNISELKDTDLSYNQAYVDYFRAV